MEDKTIRVYQGKNLIREYSQISPSYKEVCSYLGIPQKADMADNTPTVKTSSYAILDKLVKQVRFSSFYPGSDTYKAYQLNSVDAWISSPQTFNVPEKDYLQVEFNKIETVTSVCLQGRKNDTQWVKTFKLSYSLNGTQFYYINNSSEFQGNKDQNTIQIVKIPIIKTKFLRIIPVTFNTYKTCRFDVLIEN